MILEGLKFSEERRKWTASYPFFVPPSELKDNYQQVKTYTERMEKRLIKQGRVEEFNKVQGYRRKRCLQGIVGRGTEEMERHPQLYRNGGSLQERSACYHTIAHMNE